MYVSNIGILQDLYEHFSFYAKKYQFNPRFKSRAWDGKIRLFNFTTFGVIGIGLVHELIRYFIKHKYEFDIDPTIHIKRKSHNYSADNLFRSFKLDFTPHDYQIKCVNSIINQRNILVLSPTSSGKSLIIYAIARLVSDKAKRILIVVPTASLVEQLTGDFDDYSINNNFNVDNSVHQIYSGREKTTQRRITISTWQSIHNQPESWFNQFTAVIMDEAHGATAVSLTKIMNKCTEVPMKIALTGTIDDGVCHKMQLVSLFGDIYTTITTHEMIERGLASKINVKCFIFNGIHTKMNYEEEITYIIEQPILNRAICQLALTRNNTTVVLYSRVDDHGVKLVEQMQQMNTDREIFMINQNVSIAKRMEIIRRSENNPKAVIVASYATFATGINLKSITHVIFAHPFESKIRILQSIGRALRLFGSNEATIYDIILRLNYKNITFKHFLSRKSQYENAKFPYKIKEIVLT